MNFPKVLLIAGWVALSASTALAADQPMAGKASSGELPRQPIRMPSAVQ